MTQIPLTDGEKHKIQKSLDDALKPYKEQEKYISNLKAQLDTGTRWSYTPDPKEVKAMEDDCKAFTEWLYEGKPMPKLKVYKWSWTEDK